MNIRLLAIQDTKALEEYLSPHKSECMFIYSNLRATGLDYKGKDYEGEYWGYFDHQYDHIEQLLGVIVHYWNGNIMMHASSNMILEKLTWHLRNNTTRAIGGVIGPNTQAQQVLKNLEFSPDNFSINQNEGLFEIHLATLNDTPIPPNFDIVRVHEVPRNIVLEWMRAYDIEALGKSEGPHLEEGVVKDVTRLLQKEDCWILLSAGTPVSLSAFNARLEDIVQVGPVWTPPEHRNKGFARLLLTYMLHQEKRKGTKKAILFTANPAAIKAYQAIGFKKVGNYRLALMKTPINMEEI